MASQVESRPFVRSARHSTAPQRDLSDVAVSRVVVCVAMVTFLAISLVLLERRLSGAFVNSLSIFGYGLWLFLAGAFCVGLKCAIVLMPPRLSRTANTAFGGLLCGLLALFTTAVFPENWSWLSLIGTVGWLGLIDWFCCSRKAMVLCRIALLTYFWPLASEFFRRSSVPPEFHGFTGEAEDALCPPLAISRAEPHSLKLVPMPEGDEIEQCLKFETGSLDENGAGEFPESGEVTSQIVRRINSDGDDVLEAHATAVFLVGSRQAVLHIPFTPAFEETPQVECEVADGSEVRLKVGAVFPYGVRVELKRGGSDLMERTVTVDLFAVHATS